MLKYRVLSPDPAKSIAFIAGFFLAVGSTVLFFVPLRNFFAIDDFVWLFVGRFEMARPAAWLQALDANNAAGAYRPLDVNIYWWAGWKLFGFHPFGYHLLILTTLILASVYAYKAFLEIFRQQPPAFVAACLFAFSSTHYELVAWASAFAEAAPTAFFVFALYCYLKNKLRLSALWYILALLSNETTTPFPLVAVLVTLSTSSVSLREAISRTSRFWMLFAAYVLFRLFVTHLPVAHTGPFAINFNISLYTALILQSLANTIAILTPLLNNVRGSASHWGVMSNFLWLIYLGTLVIFGVLVAKSEARVRAVRIAAAGLSSLVITLFPLLLFSANNWSFYNLAIPLLGAAMCVGSLFLAPASLQSRIVPLTVGVLILCLNVVAVYGPGGWNDADGVNQLAAAAKQVYAKISFDLAHGKRVQMVNVVAEKDLENAKVVLGQDYGLAAMTGSLTSHIVYSRKPAKGRFDEAFVWHGQNRVFTLFRSIPTNSSTAVFQRGAAPRTSRNAFTHPILKYSFIGEFKHGRINSKAPASTPTGLGVGVLPWPFEGHSIPTVTVLATYRYSYFNIEVENNEFLTLIAAKPFAAGEGVRAFVDIAVPPKGAVRVFDQVLAPASGDGPQWVPFVYDLRQFVGRRITITFGADPLDDATAAWVAFGKLAIVARSRP